LGPDIADCLREIRAEGTSEVVVAPIGFVSDHMEIVYDLDYEAQNLAQELGLKMVRAATAGTHSAFVRMIRELVVERMYNEPARSIGTRGPGHDVCPADCCLPLR
jgi:ferrochelatase